MILGELCSLEHVLNYPRVIKLGISDPSKLLS